MPIFSFGLSCGCFPGASPTRAKGADILRFMYRGRLCYWVPAMLALAVTCAPVEPPDARLASAKLRYFGNISPPSENVLRFNNGSEPETYDPGLAVGQPDGRVARILFEGLTVPDPKTLAP